MPTYSYRCTECDTAFDIQQSFTDSSLTVCPTCEGKLRKVFSSIGVTFSGSGFYSNDSKSDSKRSNPNLDRKSSEKSDSTPSTPVKSDGSSSTPTTSDNTPAAKPAATSGASTPTAKAS